MEPLLSGEGDQEGTKTKGWQQVGHLRLSGSPERESNNMSSRRLRMSWRWSCSAMFLRMSKINSSCSCERRHVLEMLDAKVVAEGGRLGGWVSSNCSVCGSSSSTMQVPITATGSKVGMIGPEVWGGTRISEAEMRWEAGGACGRTGGCSSSMKVLGGSTSVQL
jgi:hypothetical protein